jgi:hypothetical protein
MNHVLITNYLWQVLHVLYNSTSCPGNCPLPRKKTSHFPVDANLSMVMADCNIRNLSVLLVMLIILMTMHQQSTGTKLLTFSFRFILIYCSNSRRNIILSHVSLLKCCVYVCWFCFLLWNAVQVSCFNEQLFLNLLLLATLSTCKWQIVKITNTCIMVVRVLSEISIFLGKALS